MTMRHTLILCASVLALGGHVWARLPTPSDDAKAKAAEAAAKAAHSGRLDNYKLCLAMDRVASVYQADAKKAGKAVAAPVATAPCSDPGAFVYPPPEAARPIEAAGAHAPTATAAAPPSTTAPAATMAPKR
jgi:hypothetical protein